ncbi:uncharacterized protein LOC113205631 isoform X2 [Frankliniella occidentalis]|nr:uncharacterized protein LOC113205631 isoform X2 [Frankliniella occidentalis]
MCQPDNRVPPWSWYVRASHFNPQTPKELQRVTGNFCTTTALDDSLWGRANMGVRSNNQWKENAFVGYFKNSACRHLRENIPGFFNAAFKQSTQTKGVCSIKPGVYEVNDYPIDWTFPKIPIMPYAHYRFNVTFGKDENLYGCFVVENRVIPKLE